MSRYPAEHWDYRFYPLRSDPDPLRRHACFPLPIFRVLSLTEGSTCAFTDTPILSKWGVLVGR